jgi:hypothetical protein
MLALVKHNNHVVNHQMLVVNLSVQVLLFNTFAFSKTVLPMVLALNKVNIS